MCTCLIKFKVGFPPLQIWCSVWSGWSLDVWQLLPVESFMLHICLPIMTGSSGFQLNRWVGNSSHHSSTFTPLVALLNTTLCLHQELEREISFQGGSGLYYYYYKHMLSAPSFERGSRVLLAFGKRDNT